MQFFHGAFCFLDGLHLNKGKPFGTLVVPITYYFGVLHVSDTVEELEQIALGRVERKISDVETWRNNFDRLGFTLGPWLALLLLLLLLCRTVATAANTGRCLVAFAIAEEGQEPLPEGGFLWGADARVLMTRRAIAPSAGISSRTARTSPGWMRFHVGAQYLPNCLWSEAHQWMHSPLRTVPGRADSQSRNSGASQETSPVHAGNKIVSNRMPP